MGFYTSRPSLSLDDPSVQNAWMKHLRESLIEAFAPAPNVVIQTPEELTTYTHNFTRAQNIFDDLMPMIESNGLCAMNYVGTMGRGKSTSAEEFATIAKEQGFLTIYGKADDIFPNLQAWIELVKEKIIQHGNPYLNLILDDMSYSSNAISNKKAAQWKNFIGDIRHQFEHVLGQGVKPKIFLIVIAHRYHAVPPILRSAVTWVFASMDNEDRIDAIKMLPKDPQQIQRLDKIYTFLQKVNIDGPKLGKIALGVGSKRTWFIWGNEEQPGDGRLMMLYHKARVQLFNPRRAENSVDLSKCEIKQIVKESSETGMPESDLFPSQLRKVHCDKCGFDVETKIPVGKRVRCTKCRKNIESEYKIVTTEPTIDNDGLSGELEIAETI